MLFVGHIWIAIIRLGWTEHSLCLFELFDAISTDLRVSDRLWHVTATDLNLFQAFVILIEEALEVEDLPALLASKVVSQCLQLVQHHIFNVVVIEHGV